MSDESKDHPPSKLKLSRDLKAQEAPEADKAPPSIHLRRKEPAEEPPVVAAMPTPPVDATSTQKADFDPNNPFGDAIKEGEIKKMPRPPPELRSKPAPKMDDGSGAKLEEAIQSLSSDDDAGSKNSLFSSIFVILLLLLVLAGAGYGLWKVLQPTEDTPPADTAESKPAETASLKGPIQKANDAIAKVPVADVEAITADSPPAEVPMDVPVDVRLEAERAKAETTRAKPVARIGSIESSKQSVSQYLSGIHIGGVRKGDRPMILIEGQSYHLGDVVQPETGLKFDGLRDGRLAFKDSHGIVYLKSF